MPLFFLRSIVLDLIFAAFTI